MNFVRSRFASPAFGLALAALFLVRADGVGAEPFRVVHSFNQGTEGIANTSPLIEGQDGRLYGTSQQGGNSGDGTVFAVNRNGTGFVVLHHFSTLRTEGQYPGAVVQGSDGWLYGSTTQNAVIRIFALHPGMAGSFRILRVFSSSEGNGGTAPLIRGTDGRLYGTAVDGGTGSHVGTVFAVDVSNLNDVQVQVLHVFSNGDGAAPRGSLVQGSDGRLYGTASLGGAHGGGTIFALNTDGSGFTVLRHLGVGSDGREPYAGLVEGSGGWFYGVNREGGGSSNSAGTMFAIRALSAMSESEAEYRMLYDFNANINVNGRWPQASLVIGPGDQLFGTTTNTRSRAFRFQLANSAFTVLKAFDPANDDGDNLVGGLVLAGDGRLYGAASTGGKRGGGTIYGLDADGSDFDVLHHSATRPRGYHPVGRFVELGGKLYGVTASGANNEASPGSVAAYGTLYSINPDGTGFDVVRNLAGSTGALRFSPAGGVILANNGRFYGMSSIAGQSAIFSIDPSGAHDATVAHAFSNVEDQGGTELVKGPDGRLYGVVRISSVLSRIFAYDPATAVYEIVHSLGSSQGGYTANSFRGLVLASDNRLYGATDAGGANGFGTIFSLRPSEVDPDFRVLHSFDRNSDGYDPLDRLTEGRDGRLYGTASRAGPRAGGTAFAIGQVGSGVGFEVLFAFRGGSAGEPLSPQSTLIEGTDGSLYGITGVIGGTRPSEGEIFALRRNTEGTAWELHVLHAFVSETDGRGDAVTGLMLASNGSLRAVSRGFGPYGVGTAFTLTLPKITSPLAAHGVYATPFNYWITASGEPDYFDAIDLPPNLSVNHATGQISGVPMQVGSFPVAIAVASTTGSDAAMLNLTIAKAVASVSLANLDQAYDGTPKSVSVTTEPAGLPTEVTYAGSSTPPTDPGSYAVVATVQDANYEGGVQGTLVISGSLPIPVDVTSQLRITPGGFRYNRTIQRYTQTITVTNTSSAPIAGPAVLVFDGLPPSVTVTAAGYTSNVAPLGRPYVVLNLGGDGILAAGETITVTANFYNPFNQPFTYQSRVLAGPGQP